MHRHMHHVLSQGGQRRRRGGVGDSPKGNYIHHMEKRGAILRSIQAPAPAPTLLSVGTSTRYGPDASKEHSTNHGDIQTLHLQLPKCRASCCFTGEHALECRGGQGKKRKGDAKRAIGACPGVHTLNCRMYSLARCEMDVRFKLSTSRLVSCVSALRPALLIRTFCT